MNSPPADHRRVLGPRSPDKYNFGTAGRPPRDAWTKRPQTSIAKPEAGRVAAPAEFVDAPRPESSDADRSGEYVAQLDPIGEPRRHKWSSPTERGSGLDRNGRDARQGGRRAIGMRMTATPTPRHEGPFRSGLECTKPGPVACVTAGLAQPWSSGVAADDLRVARGELGSPSAHLSMTAEDKKSQPLRWI